MTATCAIGSRAASTLRVAWVTPVLGVDGKLLYAGPLLRAFSQQFAAMRIFTGEYTGPDEGLDIERCTSLRLYRNERRTPAAGTSYGGGMRLATPALIARLLRWRPDLVVLNEFSIFSVYASLYAKLLARHTRMLLIMEAKPCFPSRFGTGHARIALRRTLLRGVDAVLTNNTEGRQYLEVVLGVPPEAIVAQPYLVSELSRNGDEPPPVRHHDGSRPVHFLYVGQLIPRKGVQQALEACAQLLPKHAGRFVYDIVGDGPARAQLQATSAALGLQQHVVFHGRRPYAALAQIYRAADAFLFPTLSDYRSLVPFEALSMGLPILASIYDGGVSETVHEGENGFAIDPLNPAATAARMARLIESPELIERFSAHSAKLARRYTLPQAVDAFVKACDLALSR